MKLKRITEELNRFLMHEISDETKRNLIKGREEEVRKKQAELAAAKKKLDRAQDAVRKSYERQVANLPTVTDKVTAENILDDLKSTMKRYGGDDWRFETEGNAYVLEVRYWGEWENPEDAEDEEDYDWQELTPEYRDILVRILIEITKRYGVRIREISSEKNWLCFEVSFNKLTQDSVLPIDDETKLVTNLKDVGGHIITQTVLYDQPVLTVVVDMYAAPYENTKTPNEYEIVLDNKGVYNVNIGDETKQAESIEAATDYIKQEVEKSEEEHEEYLKTKELIRENKAWFKRQVLNDDRVTKFRLIAGDSVFIISGQREVTFKKTQTGKRHYLEVTENGRTKKLPLKQNQADFKEWVQAAINLL